MTRPPYHRVNPARPRPGRVPKQRSTPPPTSSGKGTAGGFGCPMAIPALPVLLLVALVRHLFSPAGSAAGCAALSRPGTTTTLARQGVVGPAKAGLGMAWQGKE